MEQRCGRDILSWDVAAFLFRRPDLSLAVWPSPPAEKSLRVTGERRAQEFPRWAGGGPAGFCEATQAWRPRVPPAAIVFPFCLHTQLHAGVQPFRPVNRGQPPQGSSARGEASPGLSLKAYAEQNGPNLQRRYRWHRRERLGFVATDQRAGFTAVQVEGGCRVPVPSARTSPVA